ncbi:PP2C family protein-serine/threonine phosphatase [Cellulomonas sp. Marseille-Q8402]
MITPEGDIGLGSRMRRWGVAGSRSPRTDAPEPVTAVPPDLPVPRDGAEPGPGADALPCSVTRRLAALERLGAVSADPEPRFDRVVRLAKQVFDVPTATVTLVEAGADHGALPVDAAVLEDRGPDARLRFYAEHPLVDPDGSLRGMLCIADTRPRQFTADQSALLRDLAHWVAQELALDARLGRAQQLQLGLLPHETPQVRGYELAASCLPGPDVGGDFYDWYAADDGVVLTLADVTGSGPAAAILAAAVRALLRGSAFGAPVDRAMVDAGAVLQADPSRSGLSATAFHARLDPATGRLEYGDAGHGLTLVLRADGTWDRLATLGPPLGVSDEATRALAETHLGPGDLLVAFSDGVLDLFDGTPRCLPLLAGELLHCPTADEAVQRVLRLAAAADARRDDITVLAVRRGGA